MTPGVTWRTVAEPIGGWLFRRLPTFIFRRYYSPQELANDLKIGLRSAKFETVKLIRGLHAPYFEVELEAFNMSPYLDVNVTGVLSHLEAYGEEVLETFADLDRSWGFDLPRSTSRPFLLTYWLN